MSIMNLDKYLGRSKNRIYRVGVELEGGWKTLPDGISNVETDGSVSVTGYEMRTNPDGSRTKVDLKLHKGELKSPILAPDEQGTWFPVMDFVRRNYPSHTNKSCGLHVHMSFESARHYSLLLTPDFQETIVEYLKRWSEARDFSKETHPIWPRLLGQNTYCKLEYFGDAQAAADRKNYTHERHGSRYTAINYAYGQHSTVECRVLPMFEKADNAVLAIQQVLDLTNACLVSLRRKEQEHKAEVTFDITAEVRESSRLFIPPEQDNEEQEEFVCGH